jgi:hypothetical protein
LLVLTQTLTGWADVGNGPTGRSTADRIGRLLEDCSQQLRVPTRGSLGPPRYRSAQLTENLSKEKYFSKI